MRAIHADRNSAAVFPNHDYKLIDLKLGEHCGGILERDLGNETPTSRSAQSHSVICVTDPEGGLGKCKILIYYHSRKRK